MVDKNSRTWGDSGTEPAAGEEVIPGGAEYPADWMNWAMWAMTTDIDALVSVVGSLEAVNGITEVRYETLADRPAAGQAGRFSILSDEQRVTIDDGQQWVTVGAHSHDDLTDISEGDHRSAEQVRDLAGGMAGTALEHNDANDALNVVQEDVEDWVAGLVAGKSNISVTYDDANDALYVDTSALNEEEVEDAVAGLLSSSDNVGWNYDDAGDTLTVSLSGPIKGVQIGTDATRADVFADSVDANSVSTKEGPSDKLRVDASSNDAQSRIENAPQESEIELYGGDYDPGSRTDIPADSSLRLLDSCEFAPSTDYDGFFLNHGSHLSADSTLFDGYSSTVAVLDTAEAGGGYTAVTDTGATVDLEVRSDNQSGTGVLLRASGDDSITTGNHINIKGEYLDIGIDHHITGSGFLNSVQGQIDLKDCRIGLDKRGDEQPANAMYRGTIEGFGTAADAAIRNQTNSEFVFFRGQLYDPGAYNVGIFVGPKIQAVVDGTAREDYEGKFDPGPAGSLNETTIWVRGGNTEYIHDAENGSHFRKKYVAGLMEVFYGDTRVFDFRRDEGIDYQEGAPLLMDDDGSSISSRRGLYWDSADGRLELKDGSGTIHYFTPEGTE